MSDVRPLPALDRRRTRAVLFGILALALALRVIGLGFGLPNARHAYPYNPDEWTPMQVLKNMDPGRLDFNPHYFFNPTFLYYLYGAGFAAMHLLRIVDLRGDDRFYFAHPEHLARMIGMGRLLSALFGAATVWLVYRLARRMGVSRRVSLLAAGLLAIHPSHVAHGHFMTVNSAVTFWGTLAILLVVRWTRKGGYRPALAAGVVIGLAASTKYSAALLLPLAAFAALLRLVSGRRASTIGEAGSIGVAAGAAFLAGTPYALLAPGEFLRGFHEMSSYIGEPGDSVEFLAGLVRTLRVHVWASSPFLLTLGAIGLIGLVRWRDRAVAWVVAGWTAAFLASTFGAGSLASDSRFLPLYPTLAVCAAIPTAALWRRSPAGRALVGLTVATLLVLVAMVIGRFVGEMPQEAASRWMAQSVPDTASVRLSGSAIYYFPDLPLREFLASENPGAYPRQTRWRFVPGKGFTAGRAARPDYVVLTVWLPRKPAEMEWLSQPDYEAVAFFPGKVRFLGRRVRIPLDLYDTDTWILRRRESSPRS